MVHIACNRGMYYNEGYVFFLSEFSSWIISRLLRIAATPSCKPLHKKIAGVIHSLLFLFKNKSPSLFGKHTNEFLHLFEDLIQLHKESLGGSAEWPSAVSRFLCDGLESQANLRSATFQLTNIQQVESLETTMLMVLADNYADISAFYFQRQNLILWGIGCSLLDYGGSQLKVQALHFLKELVVLGGPPEQPAHYFFTVFFGMLTYIKDMDLEEQLLFEVPLLNFVKVLFPLEPESHLNVEPVYLNMLLKKLALMFQDGILKIVQSGALREALCHIVQYFLTVVPPGYESAKEVRNDHVHCIYEAFVEVLGNQSQQMVRNVVNDVRQNSWHAGSKSLGRSA